MSFLEAQALKKIFSIKKNQQVIFENLNFKIEKGEFITLLGPSGCGKSTLIRLLGGLDTPTSGCILGQTSRKSFVFQEPRLLAWRNCLENTLLPVEIENGQLTSKDRARAMALLAQLGLSEAHRKFPHQLSGGMKMRTAVARSLMTNPDFLLLDEPFAALDETTRHHLQAEFRALYERHGWTVVFVTHSIEEACFLSSRIFIFSKTRDSLIQTSPHLPASRGAELRAQVEFFKEVQRIRELFEREALS